MNIELYSQIVSVSVLLLLAAVFVSVISYIASPDFRTRITNIGYITWMKLIGALAIISTLGALTYQFIYTTPVCEMCWWQRIFMFPIDIIVLIALLQKDYVIEKMTLALSGIGLLFAIYHYYLHFQIFVLNNEVTSNCNIYGTLPSCTESPVVVFGFVTIPFMALVAFLAIFLISLHLVITKSKK